MGQDQGQWSPATETRPFWTLYSVLYQLWSFPIWLVGTGTAPGSVGVLTTIASYLLRWKSVVLSPSLGCFPYLHAPTSTQLNTQGWPSAGLWSSVSSLTFCPANSSRRLLPRFSTLSPQLSESPPLALPLPVLCPGNSLRAINSEVIEVASFAAYLSTITILPDWCSLSWKPRNCIFYSQKVNEVLSPSPGSHTSLFSEYPAG